MSYCVWNAMGQYDENNTNSFQIIYEGIIAIFLQLKNNVTHFSFPIYQYFSWRIVSC